MLTNFKMEVPTSWLHHKSFFHKVCSAPENMCNYNYKLNKLLKTLKKTNQQSKKEAIFTLLLSSKPSVLPK